MCWEQRGSGSQCRQREFWKHFHEAFSAVGSPLGCSGLSCGIRDVALGNRTAMTMMLPYRMSSASDLNVSACPELPVFPGKLGLYK